MTLVGEPDAEDHESGDRRTHNTDTREQIPSRLELTQVGLSAKSRDDALP